MARGMKEASGGGQTGPMVNHHKNMAQGASVDTGAGSVPNMLGGKAPRTNPNRKISHSPLSDSSRCCPPPRGGSASMMNMGCMCDPNHGPF